MLNPSTECDLKQTLGNFSKSKPTRKKKKKVFFFWGTLEATWHTDFQLQHLVNQIFKKISKAPTRDLNEKKMFRASLRNDISPFHTLSSNLLLSFRSLTYFLSLPKASALYKRRRKFGLVFLLSKFKLSCVVGAFDARVEKKKSTKTNKKQKRT